MPRPSLNPERAKQGGGGPEAGNYLVVASKFQNLKTDYRPNQLCQVLDCQVLDKDGEPVRGADNVDMTFSFGEKSLEAFHPGQADSPEDESIDQGAAIDAEGNTIYCEEEGAQFNKSCGAIVFNETLVKHGFPKSILDRCWAADFVGLKFELAVKTGKEINDQYNTRLSTKPTKDGGTVTYKIAAKWLNPNFLSNGSGKGKASSKSTDNGTEAAAKLTDPDEIAKHVLSLVAKLKAGEKNKVKTKAALVGFFTNEYAKSKQNPKQLAECQKLVKNDEWLADALAELGAVYDEGVTVFPEPE